MRRLRVLTTPAFLFSGAEITNRLISVVALMIPSRHYGVAEFGRLGGAIALAGILTMLTTFVAQSSLTRDLCQQPARGVAILSNYLWQRLAVMVLSSAVLALAFQIAQPASLWLNVCCYLYLFGVQTVMTGRSGLLARERFRAAAVTSVTHSLLILLATYFPVRLGFPLDAMAASLALSQVLSLAIVLLLSARHGYSLLGLVRQQVDWSYLWQDLRRNVPLWISITFISCYARLNAVFCQALQGDYATGLFSGAQRLFLGFSLIAGIYQQVTYPRVVRDVAVREQVGEYLELSARVLVTAGQLVATAATLGGIQLMAAIWGKDYSAGGLTLQVLIWALSFNLTSAVFANVLVADGRTPLLMRVTGLALLVNVAANYALIVTLGATGASLATVLTEGVVLGGLVVCLRRYGRTGATLSVLLRSTLIAAGSVLAAIAAGRAGAPAALTLLLGVALFCGGSWRLRVVRRQDLRGLLSRLVPEPVAPRPAGAGEEFVDAQ